MVELGPRFRSLLVEVQILCVMDYLHFAQITYLSGEDTITVPQYLIFIAGGCTVDEAMYNGLFNFDMLPGINDKGNTIGSA